MKGANFSAVRLNEKYLGEAKKGVILDEETWKQLRENISLPEGLSLATSYKKSEGEASF